MSVGVSTTYVGGNRNGIRVVCKYLFCTKVVIPNLLRYKGR